MIEERETKLQRFSDRSALGYAEYGDPAGAPVLAFHGTPGSRFKYRASDGPARQLGLKIIAPDRRGYGLSPMGNAEPSLRGWSDDIRAFADALDMPRFGVMGISGGGPFAAAVAALLKERVTALALISPVGPLDDPSMRAELSAFHRLTFLGLPKHPTLLRLTWRGLRAGLQFAPDRAIRLAFLRGPRADRAIIQENPFRLDLIEIFQEGLRIGVAGAVNDMEIFCRPWGLPLSAIAAPARLWIGGRDGNVPVAAALHLADLIPGCALDILPEAGHLWIVNHVGDVLTWFAEAGA
jgi:pimeloyl-ACP methyl ester carboxylesterase